MRRRLPAQPFRPSALPPFLSVPAQSLQTDAFVLAKHPPSESFETLALFSAEHGRLLALHRVSKKPNSAIAALDLFDEASVLLETSNQGRTYFVREARVLTRPSGIGRNYEALRLASAFAAVIDRNSVDEDSRGGVAALLRTAFNAFGASERPDIVYLKSLYRFARDEGHPLKEQWFPTLPASDRAAVTVLLNRPLSEQTASVELVQRLIRRLEEYLRGHTEIIIEGK